MNEFLSHLSLVFVAFYSMSAIFCVLSVFFYGNTVVFKSLNPTKKTTKTALAHVFRLFSVSSLIGLMFFQKYRLGFSINDYVPYLFCYGIVFLGGIAALMVASKYLIRYR
jgi:hypothetical protein